jgi:antirestriction protein ArdC
MTRRTSWIELSPKKREEIKTTREKKLVEARARLACGVASLMKSDRWKEYLKFSLKFHHYSFMNTLLIMMQRPDATCVASYKNWKFLGRHVRKDERGIEIFVPILALIRNLEDDKDQAARIPEEIIPAGKTRERRRKQLVGFKTGFVFDVSQTDGDPLPKHPPSRLEGDDAGMFAMLKAAIEDLLRIPVSFSTLSPGTFGLCRYAPDQDCQPITILLSDDPTLSGAQKLDTLAHEAGHAMLHSGLQYRQHSKRSIRELEAESTAYCILTVLGFDPGDISFGYIATWMEGGAEETLKEIESSGQRILDASRRILTWIEQNSSLPAEYQIEIITEDQIVI